MACVLLAVLVIARSYFCGLGETPATVVLDVAVTGFGLGLAAVAGGVPVAVPVFVIDPARTSAVVVVYVAVLEPYVGVRRQSVVLWLGYAAAMLIALIVDFGVSEQIAAGGGATNGTIFAQTVFQAPVVEEFHEEL